MLKHNKAFAPVNKPLIVYKYLYNTVYPIGLWLDDTPNGNIITPGLIIIYVKMQPLAWWITFQASFLKM
jgi:hypothetical protein